MKTTGLRLIALWWLTLVGQACGRDDGNKLRNDPTYSTRNYKHANKADSARKWENKKGVAVKPPKPDESTVANYKRQVPQAPVGGVTVDYTPSTNVADRNYKIQRPGQSTGLLGSGVIATKKDRAGKTTTTGD